MKKGFIFVLMVLVAIFGFVSCNGDGVTPEPAPTPEPEVPPTFEEVIGGSFWTVNRVEKYQDTGAKNAIDPYELGICSYWKDNGEIWFYEDLHDDGIISPSDPVEGPESWAIVDGKLVVGGMEWVISYFGIDGWAIEADVTGTVFGDLLGNEYGSYEGWARIHYVSCDKVFDSDIIQAQFPFTFNDLNDTTLLEVSKWCKCQGVCSCENLMIADIVDGFAFDFGEQRVVVGNFSIPCGGIEVNHHFRWRKGTRIGINDDWYGFLMTEQTDGEETWWEISPACEGFTQMTYLMTMSVDSAGYSIFDFIDADEFQGREGHKFSVEGYDLLDRDRLGALLVPVAQDDVTTPYIGWPGL